jgi:UDP-2,4-diacetamido-2,4,6-trideoxy-beta-L-altropyranose hydrolase
LSPRILFAPDAGARVGGGHVMRCLTLAAALQAEGALCSLAAGEASGRLARTFGPPSLDIIDAGQDGPRPLAEALAGLGGDFDVVVIDSYRLDAADEARAGARRARIAVLDDLADRSHHCALLVDPGFERRPADYAGLVPAEAVLLTGVAYAPVRPAFAALREEAGPRRDGRKPARGLVSLGLTDLDAITAQVVDLVLPVRGGIELDVVVGAGAPSLERLLELAGRDERIRLHVDTPDMARLMLEADVAIGAGGSSTWERACLGLPSLTVVLADNQRAQARSLSGQGLTLAAEAGADLAAGLVSGWTRLVGDARLRRSMSRLGMAICDGQGARRVAAAIMALAGQAPGSSEGS